MKLRFFGLEIETGWHTDRHWSWSIEYWTEGPAVALLISPTHFGWMDLTTVFNDNGYVFGSFHLGPFWISFREEKGISPD